MSNVSRLITARIETVGPYTLAPVEGTCDYAMRPNGGQPLWTELRGKFPLYRRDGYLVRDTSGAALAVVDKDETHGGWCAWRVQSTIERDGVPVYVTRCSTGLLGKTRTDMLFQLREMATR